MPEWYRRKAVQTAWQGFAVALFYVALMRFGSRETWGASFAYGGAVLGIAALGVAFWTWRGRRAARRCVG
jgi:hypothetical protein